ncbi:MAG: helix-turn-helix transcriptional regulator [Candidatus Micrarchaeota archaeon]|nr:helix-turn-helix transcriptional regulator [Candidatus Micrarchaeota archaeon]
MENAFYSCPTLSLLHIVGKRWTIPIMEVLYFQHASMQFNAIQSALNGITPKNLSGSLKELSDAQVIKKTARKRNGVLHTDYSLTKRGAYVMEFVRSAKELGISIYGMDASCASSRCYECLEIQPSRKAKR